MDMEGRMKGRMEVDIVGVEGVPVVENSCFL